ncbi:hypothetical protein TRSC58_06463 [Trypanosoma rangeli SC58]|uniref:Uncharacterized protein n=1 Tax=Trypanosoma rangeli SC58 TaxID=429131 RepID=A0A061IXV8_TRYRA|nr:hypothetical protein TRSC58_06463 [Trypanosoma rangeli SC58]
MRRLHRITCGRSFRHVLVRMSMHISNAPNISSVSSSLTGQIPPAASLGCTSSSASVSIASPEVEETEVAPFFLSLLSDLDVLQKRWMRCFRVCITSAPTVAIEAKFMNSDIWTPVTTMPNAQLPFGLVKTVEDVLSSQSQTEHRNITLVDLHERCEDLAVAQEFLESRFPGNRLHIDHSKGTDLQGTVTHTVSVSLRGHGSVDGLYSKEEQSAKETFFGESIGASFSGTVRRALREAFEASGIPFPSRNFERDRGTSELGIYMDIIRNATNEAIEITASLVGDNQVQAVVQSSTGRRLGLLLGRREDALSIVLACVEKAAENTNNIATEEARKRIADHPVVLALPSKGLRPKEILHRLLFHTFGLAREQIRVLTSQSDEGTFVTTIDAELGWGEAQRTEAFIFSTLARAAGVSKKAAEELACIKAIQRCFPCIFENQLSYHAEVREIMNSTKATDKDSICPHISKGLLAQLRWAVQCQNKEVLFEAVQLLPNSENESLGIRTTRPLWATQLFLVDKQGTRDFVCLALDPRKSASKQKVIAATLCKCFKEECSEGVRYAIERGLIDTEGNATTCEGISAAEPLPRNDYELAAESDPFIQNLQIVSSQLVPVVQRQSLLSVFRRGVQLYVELLNERGGVDVASTGRLVECTERSPLDGSYKAQLLVQSLGDDADGTKRTLGEACHPNSAIIALFSAFKDIFDEEGIIAKAAKEDAQVEAIYRDTCQRVEELSPLPYELPAPNPLETVAQCVMLKYGLSTELRISGGGKAIQVQFFGRSPSYQTSDQAASTSQFFLGHGRGNSVLKAVVSCCKHIFDVHICSKEESLRKRRLTPLRSGSVQVPLQGKSVLALRVEEVMRELLEYKVVSSAASIHVKVDIHSTSEETRYEAHLYVVDGSRMVELERTSSMVDLLRTLQQLTEGITREMRCPTVDIDALQRQYSGPSRCNTLQQLLQVLYGLPLIVETLFKDHQWHCRLNVHIFEDFYYAIGYAVNVKKKEAVENAAKNALDRCFVAASLDVGLQENSTSIAPMSCMGEEYGFVFRKLVENAASSESLP